MGFGRHIEQLARRNLAFCVDFILELGNLLIKDEIDNKLSETSAICALERS
jgi:hypothetical protein